MAMIYVITTTTRTNHTHSNFSFAHQSRFQFSSFLCIWSCAGGASREEGGRGGGGEQHNARVVPKENFCVQHKLFLPAGIYFSFHRTGDFESLFQRPFYLSLSYVTCFLERRGRKDITFKLDKFAYYYTALIHQIISTTQTPTHSIPLSGRS